MRLLFLTAPEEVKVSHVYSVGEDSSTKQLERIACTNEDKELQRLLENNLDLLPGEQINPEEKLRWLLFKREMPVTNPSSGEIWWRAFTLARVRKASRRPS